MSIITDAMAPYRLRAFPNLDAPILQTPVVFGQPGTSTYTYVATYSTIVGETTASETISISTGAATLNGVNFIRLSVQEIPAPTTKIRYFRKDGDVYKYIGQCDPDVGILDDKGLTAQNIYPPETNTSGREDWQALLFHAGRYLGRQEMMDLQAILLKGVENLGNTLHKDGDIITGLNEAVVSGTTYSFSSGVVYVQGQYLVVPSGTATVTASGSSWVGITVTPQVITPDDDLYIRNQDEEVDLEYCQPGADRLVWNFAWTVDQPGQINVREFLNGAPKVKTMPIERTVLERTLAEQLNDVAGSFCVRPFQMKADDHPTDDTQMRIWIGPGRAYPEGFPVETYDRRWVDIPKARTTMTRQNSTTGDFYAPGATVIGTVEGPYVVDGLSVKFKVGDGNSHTVALTGSGISASGVATQIEDAINAYPSAEADDLIECIYYQGHLAMQTAPDKSLTIQSVSSDAYSVLGLSTGTTEPGGQRIYPLNDNFVKEVSDVSYPVIIVEQVTHNGNTNIDELDNANVSHIYGASSSLADCHDGKYNWHLGVDFTQNQDSIDFASLGGSNPNAGATIYVKYKFNYNATLGARQLIQVVDAQVVKGEEGGSDNIVFTGATSVTKVIDGSAVAGLSGEVSDVVSILRVNNTTGQTTDDYGQYMLAKNSTALLHATSQIDWSSATTQPVTSSTYYVSFTAWYHVTEGDFVAANSFDMYNYIEMAPDISSEYNLRDCMDFRTAGVIPADGFSPTIDYDFYLGRYDKISIDPEGNFNLMSGTPAVHPVVPRDQGGALTLSLLAVAPYTYGIWDVSLRSVEPLRITQAGIHELQRRIERLEYWQTVNDLENSVAYSASAAGSRGIFTDALTGFGRTDIAFDKNGIDFSAAIDTTENCVRLPVSQSGTLLESDVENSVGVRRLGNSIMLDFQPEVLESQPLATTTININPDDIVSFANGNLSISPEIDVFMDTEQMPDLNVDYDNNMTSLLNNLLPEKFNQVSWNAWQSNVPHAAEGAQMAEETGGWDPTAQFAGGAVTAEYIASHPSAHWTNQIGEIWRTGTKQSLQPDRQVVDLGDRVVDMTMVPMMRTKMPDGSDFEITLNATNLIPNGNYAVEISGIQVNAVATGTSEQGTAFQNKTTIKANMAGSFTAKFAMPSNIPAGQQTIKVYYTADANLSSALHSFFSSGFKSTKQSTTLGFTSPTLRTDTVEEREQLFTYFDPLAQTFIVQRSNTYIAGVGIFFATKSENIPVTCEIRYVSNGYPTRKVIASKTLTPDEITCSDDGSIETIFWFEDVCGYQPDEYCMVLTTNCTDYNVWMAELGKIDIQSQTMVMKQPAGGVLFHSPNASTWEAMTKSDLTYKLYQSNFRNDCQIVFNNLTGIEANAFVLRVEQFVAPGTNATWSYSPDGGASWVPFIAGLNTSLASVVEQVQLRVDVTSIGGNFRIIDQYAGILFLLHEEDAEVIWNQIEFTDNLAYPDKVQAYFDLDVDGVNGTGNRTITPYYSIDDGETWVELTVPAQYVAVLKKEPYYEYLFETPDEASISDATNATPIVITSSNHGFKDNAVVLIEDVEGNTNANGTWRVVNASDHTFEIVDPDTGDDIIGNSAYTTGGTIKLAEFTKCRLRATLSTGDKAQTPRIKNVRMSCIESAAA
jgi:hypothetical protein